MGIDEGVVCLGCCAGLMLVLLAVGLASVGWMAAVAAVIFSEKVLAPTPAVAKGVAVLLVGFGIAVATIPAVAAVRDGRVADVAAIASLAGCSRATVRSCDQMRRVVSLPLPAEQNGLLTLREN